MTNNNAQASGNRWIVLVGVTVALQLMLLAGIGIVAYGRFVFEGIEIWWLPVFLSLPAAWAAFSLWRFRSVAERRAGYFAVVASLYWLWVAVKASLIFLPSNPSL